MAVIADAASKNWRLYSQRVAPAATLGLFFSRAPVGFGFGCT